MRAGIYFVAVLLISGIASAAPAHLTIHNPLALQRAAVAIEIPAKLLPHGAGANWVAVANGQVAPLQRLKDGRTAIAVIDLPAQAEVDLLLRLRAAADPAPSGVARATIPIKVGGAYREVHSFAVPPTHVIHDPLFPIEGAGWESDRVGYRVYLDRRNAIDVYGKKLPAPVLHTIGQGGPSYHKEADWGMDVWHVGDSLGAGALGVLRGDTATQIGDMTKMIATVREPGPVLADLHVEDSGWVFEARPRNLVADYTIAAGSRLSMRTASATPGTKLVAGFGKYPDTVFLQPQSGPQAGWSYIATWGRQSENHLDDVGVALFYPVSEVVRTGDDGRSYYVLFKDPTKARYAFAAAWARETNGLADQAAFRAYLDRTAAELSNPVFVTAGKP
jgi:hypothetical protein